jgi:hypothetical protein
MKGSIILSIRASEALLEIMKGMFRPHPWHGVSIGGLTPEVVTRYIEIVPTDSVKYEIDKTTPAKVLQFSTLPVWADSQNLLRGARSNPLG